VSAQRGAARPGAARPGAARQGGATRPGPAPRPWHAAPARVAAFRTLARVRAGATLADALAREREALGDARDRSLAHDLATGVLRWRSALDAALATASDRAIARVDADVLDILRLGVYQMRHRDRLPAHAVVSDAVALTRLAGHTSAAGFVNAVLRRLTTTTAAAPPPDAAIAAAGLDALATQFAHPAWLVARWTARLGVEAAMAWMRFDNEPAPLTLRALPSAGTREALAGRLASAGVSVTPTRWAPAGLVVTAGNPLDQADVGFVVQDEASQVVGELAAAWPARRRLDVCAAPGGKTLALWAAGNGGQVVAGDRRPRRVRLLRDTLARAGAGGIPIVQHDAVGPLPYRDAFDLVLLDAPCSGLGTLRREPDLKWRRVEGELASMAAVQARMLAHAARVVAPGGVLVYATCSSEPDENDAVFDAFLDAHPAFEAAGRPPGAPAGVGGLLTEDGRLHTSPVTHGLEAFFAAAFRRRG
jgi:16S rRNA (cytosine967-C5)-methyltransferase